MDCKLRFERLRLIQSGADGGQRPDRLHGTGEESDWRNSHNHRSLCCQFSGRDECDDFDPAHCGERVAGNLHRGSIGNCEIYSNGHERCQELGRCMELQPWYMWELQPCDHFQWNSDYLYGTGHGASRRGW